MPDRFRPMIIGARVASVLLLCLAIMLPVVGFVSVRALTTATTASCKGANLAKQAVQSLFDTLVSNAERPIVNATPEQLARQQASIDSYNHFQRLEQQKLATVDC